MYYEDAEVCGLSLIDRILGEADKLQERHLKPPKLCQKTMI